MTKRERVYNKFNGLCAYSGTPLEEDWQIYGFRCLKCGAHPGDVNINAKNTQP